MDPLICLHGAIGHAAQMQALADALSSSHRIINLELPGHGHTPWPGEELSFEAFEEAILDCMQREGIDQANFLGYSMGGYAAACLGLKYPGKVGKLFSLGTRWLWDPETAKRETALLDPEKIQIKVPAFAALLAERHPQGWEKLLHATSDLLHRTGRAPILHPDNLPELAFPVHICLGDRDTTAGLSESLRTFQLLQMGQLSVLPGTGHAIEKMDTQAICRLVNRFLA